MVRAIILPEVKKLKTRKETKETKETKEIKDIKEKDKSLERKKIYD